MCLWKFQNTYFCRRSLLYLKDVLWTHWNIWWQDGDLGRWKRRDVIQGQSSAVLHHSTFKMLLCCSLNWCLREMWFTGVAVWGSARNHSLFCGGPCLPHQEPPHLPQRHRGHHSQPGAPGRGVDGWLQEDLLSPQQERRTNGQWGQCDLLTMFIC